MASALNARVPPGPGDSEIADRLARRDPSALEDLYSLHATAVYSLALRMCRDQTAAAEVTQTVFIQAWQDSGRFDRRRGTLRSWLLIITRTRALDRLRAQRRTDSRLSPLDEEAAPRDGAIGPTQESGVLQSERARHLSAAMSILPAFDRTLLQLAFYQGLTHTELAAHLTQPLGTIKTHIRRVLHLMRRAMVDEPGRPFAWLTETHEAQSHTGRAVLQDRAVLVVDDDPSTLALTKLVLERAGARVATASSAAQARQRLRSGMPHVLVLDVEMPEENGIALLADIRTRNGGYAVPAVAFTAHDEEADRRAIRRAGFAVHLAKPIRPSLLVTHVKELAG